MRSGRTEKSGSAQVMEEAELMGLAGTEGRYLTLAYCTQCQDYRLLMVRKIEPVISPKVCEKEGTTA